MNLETFFIKYPVHIKTTCEWTDMDAFQHINNKIYFKYFENARIAYLEKAHIFSDKILPILASTSCKYLRPLVYPEKIYIGARISQAIESKVSMDYAIYSQDQDSLVAIGDSTIVSFDYQKKEKVLLPQKWIKNIQTLSPSVIL